MNGWNYVYGNPVNLTDPTGHDPYWCESDLNPSQCYKIWLEHIQDIAKYESAQTGCSSNTPTQTPTATPTLSPTPDIQIVENINLSAYYTPVESDSKFSAEKVPIKSDQEHKKNGDYLILQRNIG